MTTPTDLQTTDDARSHRLGIGARAVAAVTLAGLMLLGILVLGRVASNDVMAMALTSVFFLLVAAGVGWLVWRRRELGVPLGATFVVVAVGAGVVLGLPLITDDVVDEDVIRVETGTSAVAGETDTDDTDAPGEQSTSDGTGTGENAPAPPGPAEVASGAFESRVHPGEGTATLIDTADGSTVLTFTDFATDNGPDLLVYLVPADAPAGSVDGFVDLGPLRGNIGDQQYDVPDDVDAGQGWRVVVWCRAFAVNFTEATLS
jgi:hypothetical protein